MDVGKKKHIYEYEKIILYGVQIINKCDEEKDRGVYFIFFYSDLSFYPHIREITANANQVLGMIRKAFSFIDKDS